jgi:hypothetical protein
VKAQCGDASVLRAGHVIFDNGVSEYRHHVNQLIVDDRIRFNGTHAQYKTGRNDIKARRDSVIGRR